MKDGFKRAAERATRMPRATDWIASETDALRDADALSSFREVGSPMGARIVVEGRRMLNLSGNDYLGFANDPALKDAATRAIHDWGVGPGAVRSIAGTTTLHAQLEDAIARFKCVESALFTPSGFAANTATIPALVGKDDIIFTDRLNHASIIDGCRLSGARIVVYDHANASDADAKMREHMPGARRGLLVTDGVFSMDGDIAPLPELWRAADAHGVMTMVDDAHGEGVLGPGGRGIVAHFGLHGKIDAEIGTFSKALGVVGGAVAGSRALTEWVRQRGRSFVYSSATSAADTAACLAAIERLAAEPVRVERLWANARRLQDGLRKAGFDCGATRTPITPVLLGENKIAQEFANRLQARGVYAMAITHPIVPRGTARIRAMPSATHTSADLDEGIDAFVAIAREMRLT